MSKKKLLFVCWGNTCRSPMAKAIASNIFKGRADFESAGIEVSTGLTATKDAITVMAERDIDISDHRAKDVNEIEINDFDMIISMTPTIADKIRTNLNLENTYLLTWNINDPYGMGLDKYRECACSLEKEIRRLFQNGEFDG